MAAIGQPIESDVRDQPPEPVSATQPPPAATDSMQVDSHVNGFAPPKDAGSELPSPPLQKGDQPNGFTVPPTAASTFPSHGAAPVSKLDALPAQPAAPATVQPVVADLDPVAPAAALNPPPLHPPVDQRPATPPAAFDHARSLPPLNHAPPASSVSSLIDPAPLPPLQQPTAALPISMPAPASVPEPDPAPAPVPALALEPAVPPPIDTTVPIATSTADSFQALPATAGPSDQPAPPALSDATPPAPAETATPVEPAPLAASPAPTAPIAAAPPAPTLAPPAAVDPQPEPTATPVDQEMQDVSSSTIKVAREREDDEEGGPDAKRTRTDAEAPAHAEQSAVFKVPELPRTPVTEQPPAIPSTTPASAPAPAPASTEALPTTETPAAPAPASTPAPGPAAASEGTQAAAVQAAIPPIDAGPLTDAQHKKLIEGMRNLKKTKHSIPFQHPVDHVALNLPTYPNIITRPMDLSTMERKLRDRQYASVDAYVDDFNTMVQNSITFNGPSHVVSHQGLNMKRQLEVQLRRLPRSDETTPTAPPKAPKQPPVSTPREPKRRESRPSLGSAQSPSSEAFALGPNGVPFIRRDSMAADGRPKREIHRPPPRDLPYSSKPKRKKFMMELKFCEYVQEEMMRTKHKPIGWPFYDPVDAVGLGLTDYHKIIKNPMDLGTAGRNLKSGIYESAADYEADVRLMFANCFKFNGPHEHVHQLGKQYQTLFDSLWRKKDEWIAANTPASERQSPEAADSSEEESSEDEDDEEDARNAQLTELQKQIALLNEQASALLQGKIAKSTKTKEKSKSGKGGKGASGKKSRKSGGGGPSSGKAEKKSKAKAKAKPVTLAQKQEISEKVVLLGQDQQARALNLITSSLHAAGRHEEAKKGEEGEFDIEKIPDETLHELLKMVRKHVGGGGSAADDGPSATTERSKSHHHHHHHSGKPKKNKPMSKYEQEDRISRLKGQLQSFQNPGSTSQSPEIGDDVKSESSGDDSDSGSESEEE